MGVIPMGEHYKSIFLSVIILADKFRFAGQKHFSSFEIFLFDESTNIILYSRRSCLWTAFFVVNLKTI